MIKKILNKFGLKAEKIWLQDSQGFTPDKIGAWDISNITVQQDGSWSYSNITAQSCWISKALEKGDGYFDRASGKERLTTKSEYFLVVPAVSMSNKEFFEKVFEAFEEIKAQERIPLIDFRPPTRKELVEALQNIMGVFDTPIARKKITGDIAEKARKQARQLLENDEAYQTTRTDLLKGFEQFFGRKK